MVVSKSLTEIDFSNCGLSVNGVNEVAQAIRAGAALNSVTVDSTGVLGYHWDDEQGKAVSNQIAYTLTAGEENIDLSSKNLG